jgi:hypothetical protein
MTPLRWALMAGTVVWFAIACADEPFGPTLSDRWGGTGAELDARQSPPTLQLTCATIVRFRDPIPLTSDGAFTVQADQAASFARGVTPVIVSGRIAGPALVLSVVQAGLPTGIPPRQLLLHRGRVGDFGDVACAD